MTDDIRYPVGKFSRVLPASDEERQSMIKQIAEAPAALREVIRGLNDEQLNTPYREGGWTVRQVVHHLPDSHLNAYVRFKLALTEANPTVKPYEEALWAELADARMAPVETSLRLLESLHERWVMLLRSLSPEDFRRPYRHPETGENVVDFLVSLYSWHGRHHVAQIRRLREKNKW